MLCSGVIDALLLMVFDNVCDTGLTIIWVQTDLFPCYSLQNVATVQVIYLFFPVALLIKFLELLQPILILLFRVSKVELLMAKQCNFIEQCR